MVCATGSLVAFAEFARSGGEHGWGNFLDIVRLAVYWFWMRLAWASSRNVDHALWTPLARTALVAGLLANALA